MPHTIQQARLVNAVSIRLVDQRRATNRQCTSIKAELDQYSVPQMALDKAQAFATNLGATLDQLQAKQAEILSAASAVGVSDFAARWTELDTVRTTLQSATVANIATRLQAVISGLPDETIL